MKSKILALSKNEEFKSLLKKKKLTNKYVTIFFKKLSSKNPNKGTVRTFHTVTNQNDKVVMTWIANFLIKTKN